MRILVLSVALMSVLMGCAQKSDKIGATYVSTLEYEPYNCRQLAAEAGRISSRAAELAGVQDKQAQSDAIATGAAIVLFWPAAFFIGGNKTNAAELARLKGELEAIEKASIQRDCGIEFRR
ncbi:MAG: hypothetical protein AAGK92_16425 [Pseudomonadota bacterium]